MTQPWNEFLALQGAELDPISVRFPGKTATAHAPLMVPLVHLALIDCHGEDAAPFLQNLLSNDVKALTGDGAAWNSFNSPKGRMLASLLTYRDPDGYGIVLSADIAPAMQKRLSMYVLRSKARLAASDAVLIGISGSTSADVLAGAGINVPAATLKQTSAEGVRCVRVQGDNYILIVEPQRAAELWQRLAAAGAQPAGTDAWHLAMIRAGLPLVTTATQEEFVAQMLNFELIGGVSFKKGCYPGQEIVARTQYLGKLKKRMFRVRVPEGHVPTVGEDLYTPKFGEQSAGKIVTVAPSPEGGHEALAVMQISCAEAGEAHIGSPQGPQLGFLELPYPLGE